MTLKLSHLSMPYRIKALSDPFLQLSSCLALEENHQVLGKESFRIETWSWKPWLLPTCSSQLAPLQSSIQS